MRSAGFMDDYVQVRDGLPRTWFDGVQRRDGGSGTSWRWSPRPIADIEAQGIWVERKVFRAVICR